MNTLNLVTQDEKVLTGHNWLVDKPIAQMLIVHGHGEHSMRYAHMAEWFNKQQVSVWGIDQRGHGLTAGDRGVARYTALLDDIELWVAHIKQADPDLPLFLYGHSMGGQLVLSFLMARDTQLLNGVIASAPWVKLAFEPLKSQYYAGRILSEVLPRFQLATNLNVALLSRDNEVVFAYQKDPLVHDKLSAELGISLIKAGNQLSNMSEVIVVPLLIMHGSADQITSPVASSAFAASNDGDITYKSWPGLYHEIHNEAEQKSVFAFALNWMIEKLNNKRKD